MSNECEKDYGLLALLLLSVFIIIAVNYSSLSVVSTFRYTHYLLNYDYGFVKRGLVGEAFSVLNISPTFLNVSIMAYSVLIINIMFFLGMLYASFSGLRLRSGTWLFVVLALTHSATMQHYYSDIGRFDGLLLIFLLCAVLAILKLNLYLQFSIVPALLIISIAIHEAAIFISVPLVICVWLYVSKSRGAILGIFSILFSLVFFTYFVSTKGLISQLSTSEHFAAIASIYDERLLSLESVQVVHAGQIKDIIFMVSNLGFTEAKIIEHLKLLMVIVPLFFILCPLIFSVVSANFISFRALVILSSFSPLCLYPLGYDHFRWWALSLTNLFVCISVISYMEIDFRMRVVNAFYDKKIWSFIVISISLATGGIGVTTALNRF